LGNVIGVQADRSLTRRRLSSTLAGSRWKSTRRGGKRDEPTQIFNQSFAQGFVISKKNQRQGREHELGEIYMDLQNRN
jgi:hypothetical protein